jgi:hypothetical protein
MSDPRETAGRLIFAVADHNGRGLIDALRDVGRDETFALVMALADTAAHALQALHGDGWRDALNLAMLAASIEEVDHGSADAR